MNNNQFNHVISSCIRSQKEMINSDYGSPNRTQELKKNNNFSSFANIEKCLNNNSIEEAINQNHTKDTVIRKLNFETHKSSNSSTNSLSKKISCIVSVNLKGNETKKIDIYEDDDIEEIAKAFCFKNNLKEQAINSLSANIKQQIEKNRASKKDKNSFGHVIPEEKHEFNSVNSTYKEKEELHKIEEFFILELNVDPKTKESVQIYRHSSPVELALKIWGKYKLKDAAIDHLAFQIRKFQIEYFENKLTSHPASLMNHDPLAIDDINPYNIFELDFSPIYSSKQAIDMKFNHAYYNKDNNDSKKLFSFNNLDAKEPKLNSNSKGKNEVSPKKISATENKKVRSKYGSLSIPKAERKNSAGLKKAFIKEPEILNYMKIRDDGHISNTDKKEQNKNKYERINSETNENPSKSSMSNLIQYTFQPKVNSNSSKLANKISRSISPVYERLLQTREFSAQKLKKYVDEFYQKNFPFKPTLESSKLSVNKQSKNSSAKRSAEESKEKTKTRLNSKQEKQSLSPFTKKTPDKIKIQQKYSQVKSPFLSPRSENLKHIIIPSKSEISFGHLKSGDLKKNIGPAKSEIPVKSPKSGDLRKTPIKSEISVTSPKSGDLKRITNIPSPIQKTLLKRPFSGVKISNENHATPTKQLSEAQFELLQQLFEKLDNNKDGKISVLNLHCNLEDRRLNNVLIKLAYLVEATLKMNFRQFLDYLIKFNMKDKVLEVIFLI